jgi:AraC family ethanolamine operon transcriptional activator
MTLTANKVNSTTTSDLEAHRESVQPNQVRYDQLSPGKFASRLESINIDGLLLYRVRWNQRVHVTGANPEGYILIGFSAGATVWRGETMDSTHLALNDASNELDFTTGKLADHYSLLVPIDQLARHFGEATSEMMRNTRKLLACEPTSAVAFAHCLHQVLRTYLPHHELLDDKRKSAALQHELLDASAEIYSGKHDRPANICWSTRRKALTKAMAYARDLQEPLRLPALAKATGMSLRSLEHAFKETLGITPVKFLRWTRLNHARRALLAAEPGATTVSNIATDWGFSDLSHMAVEYRHLFGESPSITLARGL